MNDRNESLTAAQWDLDRLRETVCRMVAERHETQDEMRLLEADLDLFRDANAEYAADVELLRGERGYLQERVAALEKELKAAVARNNNHTE